MEFIVMPKEEFENLLTRKLKEILKDNCEAVTPIQPKQQEGDVKFALEILKEKAGLDSLPTLYKWSHDGRVPCTKRGKKLWFNRIELESWIEDGMPHSGQMKAANRLSNLVG